MVTSANLVTSWVDAIHSAITCSSYFIISHHYNNTFKDEFQVDKHDQLIYTSISDTSNKNNVIMKVI